MGGGKWSASDWDSYSTTHVASKKTVDEVYTARSIAKETDPTGIENRESRDSVDNPNSTAIIVATDVTGSMDRVLDSLIRKGLPALAEEIYNRKPVTDPHIMFMAVGDVECDRSPLQVTQFEADIRIAEQLTKLYLERGGGGNDFESYTLPWYFAAYHTSIDCYEKRGVKGVLFTMGDEEPNPRITASHIKKVLGYLPQTPEFSAEELLAKVSQQYDVYHLMIEEGHNYSRSVSSKWHNLLGQRAIPLSDHTKMGEVIVSILQVRGGADKETVSRSWDGSTSVVVSRAISGLTTEGKDDEGLVTL